MDRADVFALSLDGNGGILGKKRDAGQYVAVTYPWVSSVIHPLGAVIGFVDINYFRDVLQISERGYEQGVYLFKAGEELQFKQERGLELSEADLEEVASRFVDSGITAGRINGEPCFVITAESAVTDWSYLAVIPKRQFFFQYIYSQNRVVGLITFLLLLCILAGIVAVFWLYRPVQELWMLLNQPDQERPDRNREAVVVDEWKSLRSSITGIVEKNKDIMKELDETRLQRRQGILRGLLLGTVNLADIKETLDNYEIAFPEDFFCVVVFYSLKPVMSGQRERMSKLIDTL